MTVLEAGSNAPIVTYPDELTFDAMYRMLQNNIGRLPVVSREDPGRMVGYFNRSSILGAWSRANAGKRTMCANTAGSAAGELRKVVSF